MKSKLILFLLMCNCLVYGQTDTESAKAALKKYIHYWSIENNVPADTLDQWTQWLVKAENVSTPFSERAVQYKLLYSSLYHAFKGEKDQFKSIFIDQGRIAQMAAISNTSPLQWKAREKFLDNNELGKIEKTGVGKTTVIALPSFEYNSSIFDNLLKVCGYDFTFYSITYPGIAGTLPYKLDEKRDLANKPWLTNLTTGILEKVIAKNKVSSFYIIAHNHSLELALLIAMAKPEMVKGIIYLNGSNAKMLNLGSGFTMTPASALATTQEKRLELINKDFPVEDLIPPGSYFNFNSYQSIYTVDRKLSIRQLPEIEKGNNLYAVGNYIHETMAIDVKAALSKLQVPVLEIMPKHDELSPFVVMNRRHIQIRRKYHKTNSNIHLALVEGRDLFFYEFPERVSAHVSNFVKGMPLSIDDMAPTNVVNESPSAVTEQTFSNTDVKVKYYRPAIKGREIFGKLVPFNQVWRAGANLATEISFSRDVTINDKLLQKGKYCFFIIPKADQWTLIFNSIADQYGAFAYDSAMDVMRIKVNIQKAPNQEWLKYDFENLTASSADLSIHWADTKVAITIKETFNPPLASSKHINLNWTKLLDDEENDGADKGRMKGRTPSDADGKSLYYYFDKLNDSIWFKLDTYTVTNMLAPAVSISLDTDADQGNGVNWYGSNQQFKVDLMISCGPVRQGNAYAGYNGVTDDSGIKTRNWINVKEDNVKFYFSPGTKSIIIGMRRQDIKPGIKKFNLIGSVGDYSTWNDDIGKDGGFATIELKD